jgi:hypothetical protein
VASVVGGGPQPRRPVEVLDPVDVDRRDPRPAALQLERPEALERADVQGAHAREVFGEPVMANEGPQIEHARGDDPRPELLRVVPADVVEPRSNPPKRVRLAGLSPSLGNLVGRHDEKLTHTQPWVR